MMGSVIGGARKKVKSGKDFAKRQVSQGRIVNNLVRGPIKPKPKPNPKPHVGKKAPAKNNAGKNTSRYKTSQQKPYKKQDANIPKANSKPSDSVITDGSQIIKGKNGRKVLKKNISYKTKNGARYKTDNYGRVKEVVQKDLKFGKGNRNKHSQAQAGREDRLPGDEGGHLIGAQFGGSGDFDNLVPMSRNINRNPGKWYKMEARWKKALESGKKVTDIKIIPNYKGNSQRPVSFEVTYKIDGVPSKPLKIANQ